MCNAHISVYIHTPLGNHAERGHGHVCAPHTAIVRSVTSNNIQTRFLFLRKK
jgi:hypothetical protein